MVLWFSAFVISLTPFWRTLVVHMPHTLMGPSMASCQLSCEVKMCLKPSKAWNRPSNYFCIEAASSAVSFISVSLSGHAMKEFILWLHLPLMVTFSFESLFIGDLSYMVCSLLWLLALLAWFCCVCSSHLVVLKFQNLACLGTLVIQGIQRMCKFLVCLCAEWLHGYI